MSERGTSCGWAVAAAHPGAAEAGASLLSAGGNAIDAACAMAWALAVCEPSESGLGGQTTMLVRLAGGRTFAMDGHSRAPMKLSRREVSSRMQETGLASSTVPSTPLSLLTAQREYGRLAVSDAIAPAIVLAREGYAMTRLQRTLVRWSRGSWEVGSPESRAFLDTNGRPPAVGRCFRQPQLARTLERLRDHGVEDFYHGEIAREIAADMAARGGCMTARDLATLRPPVEREPLRGVYRGHEVLSLPPPGGGVQLLLGLRLTELLESWGVEPTVARALAARCVFEERERWPDHPADCDRSVLRWLVSDGRANMLAERVLEGHRAPVVDSLGESGNTTHLCAADAEGNVVTLTQSLQSVFGAKRVHPSLGFVYNNYLMTCPRHPHPYRLKGGGIPQSNASPTIVLNKDVSVRLAVGAAGSRRITTSLMRVITGIMDRGESLSTAIEAPRVHALLDGRAWIEGGADEATARRLESRGFRLKRFGPLHYKFGAVQGIEWRRMGDPRAAADPRRDGAVRHACTALASSLGTEGAR